MNNSKKKTEITNKLKFLACPKRTLHLVMRFLNLQYDICGRPFCDCELGYLLPHYDPKVLGKRVMTDLAATHPKPTCVQTKAPLLKLW